MKKKKTFIQRKKSPNTFLGLPCARDSYQKADVVILPLSYEGTASYGRGTKKGPRAIIKASHFVEWYDEEVDSQLYPAVSIYTAPEERGSDSLHPKAFINKVYRSTKKLLSDNKFVCALGGEHTVSLGVMQAYCESFPRMSILHIDAHADLRARYEGTEFSHACVMRHIAEKAQLTQVGIRSVSREEIDFIREKGVHVFFAKDIYNNNLWINNVLKTLRQDVYVTIDVDGLDPSIVPSTGTPEPGGLTWYQLLSLLAEVARSRHVRGFDLVELAPQKASHASSFICAKLCYKLLNYVYS